jgi:uncharacterized damage-inducible protein DinB
MWYHRSEILQIQDMLTLYEYNYWANKQILAAAARVSQEQFSAPSGRSYGSLHSTLLHTLDSEFGWRMLCQYSQLTLALSAAEFPSLELIQMRWQEEETAMRTYLAGLHDDLDGLVRYTTDSGEKRERVLWHCLLHVVNHGTQHRSEAADLLTEYGSSPGDLDFTVFLNEQR